MGPPYGNGSETHAPLHVFASMTHTLGTAYVSGDVGNYILLYLHTTNESAMRVEVIWWNRIT